MHKSMDNASKWAISRTISALSVDSTISLLKICAPIFIRDLHQKVSEFILIAL